MAQECKKIGKERRAERKLHFSLLLTHVFCGGGTLTTTALIKIASFKIFNVSKDPDLDFEISASLAPNIMQVYSYLYPHIEVKAQVLLDFRPMQG